MNTNDNELKKKNNFKELCKIILVEGRELKEKTRKIILRTVKIKKKQQKVEMKQKINHFRAKRNNNRRRLQRL
jgi:hypothetical protein